MVILNQWLKLSLTLLTLSVSSFAQSPENCANTNSNENGPVGDSTTHALGTVIQKLDSSKNGSACGEPIKLQSSDDKAVIDACIAALNSPSQELSDQLKAMRNKLSSAKTSVDDLCALSGSKSSTNTIQLLASLERLIYQGDSPEKNSFQARVDKALCEEAYRSLRSAPSGLRSALNEVTSLSEYRRAGRKMETNHLSSTDRKAIRYYAGIGYTPMNNVLRSGQPISGEIKDSIQHLNSALGKLPDYQGIAFRHESALPPKVWEDESHIGNTITNAAFTSTSKSSMYMLPVGHSFIVLSIHGKQIEDVGGLKPEHEVLFKSGTRFKIMDAQLTSDGGQIIMREVP